LYDYGRLGADGSARELHIEKGVACADLNPSVCVKPKKGFLAACEYFSVKKRIVTSQASGFVSEKSFLSVLVLEGSGQIKLGEEQIDFVKGDSIFIAANAGEYAVNGVCEILETTAGDF
jgi:mannose-6-phosphate isomerase